MRNLELKRWEYALIVFSVFIFMSAAMMYVTNFPLRIYIFDITPEGARNPIGKIFQKNGELRRQFSGELEFQVIGQETPVFDQDTLVTNPSSSASVQLDDGSVLELGPATMVRLSYENQLSLQGITRAARVQVVTGNVTGKAVTRKIIVKTKDRVFSIPKDTVQTVNSVHVSTPVVVAKPAPIPVPVPVPAPAVTEVPKVVVAPPVPAPLPAPVSVPAPEPPPAFASRLKRLELTSPARGTKFKIANGSTVTEKRVDLEWKVQPADAKILMRIARMGDKEVEVFRDILTANKQGKGKFSWVAKEPGTYVWGVAEEQASQLPKSAKKRSVFTVDPDFQGIELLDPLVGGQKISSNLLKGKQLKNFDVLIRWRPYKGAKEYKIWFSKSPNDRSGALLKTVEGTEYEFNKNKIYSGRIYYKVTSTMPSGFVVSSKQRPFIFNFLPPILVMPTDKTVLSKGTMAASGNNTVLMTWQKTNFTEEYELEIAEDPDFTQFALKKRLKTNYFVFTPEKLGKYWWRIISHAKEMSSSPSQANQLIFGP